MLSKKEFDNCVCDVVKDIVAAQDEVMNNDNCCTTSCEMSIRDLVSPQAGNGPVNDTIPFILYCENCKPFVASGVFKDVPGPPGNAGITQNTFFECVETPIFRAKKFVDDSDCCVKLELLLPVTQGGVAPGPTGSGVSDVCPFFPGGSIEDFLATGICITVDLNCFCGITCLDPITPRTAADFPPMPRP